MEVWGGVSNKRTEMLYEKINYESGSYVVTRQKIRNPDGTSKITENVAIKVDAVCVVPVDSENNVYLIKEWRPTYRKIVLMVPSGGVSTAASSKNRLKQARAELREETGLDCKTLKHMGAVLGLGRVKQRADIYLATGLYRNPLPRDKGEYMEVVRLPLQTAIEKLVKGRASPTISHSALGLLLAERELKNK